MYAYLILHFNWYTLIHTFFYFLLTWHSVILTQSPGCENRVKWQTRGFLRTYCFRGNDSRGCVWFRIVLKMIKHLKNLSLAPKNQCLWFLKHLFGMLILEYLEVNMWDSETKRIYWFHKNTQSWRFWPAKIKQSFDCLFFFNTCLAYNIGHRMIFISCVRKLREQDCFILKPCSCVQNVMCFFFF